MENAQPQQWFYCSELGIKPVTVIASTDNTVRIRHDDGLTERHTIKTDNHLFTPSVHNAINYVREKHNARQKQIDELTTRLNRHRDNLSKFIASQTEFATKLAVEGLTRPLFECAVGDTVTLLEYTPEQTPAYKFINEKLSGLKFRVIEIDKKYDGTPDNIVCLKSLDDGQIHLIYENIRVFVS